MKYKEYKLHMKPEEIASAAEALTALGMDEIIINDPADFSQFSEENAEDRDAQGSVIWDFVDEKVRVQMQDAWISFYLQEDEQLAPQLASYIKKYDIQLTLTDDEDWLHKWEEYYVPMKITDKIVVKPVWREYEKQDNEIVVDIDPGLAFGTGTSPTTYLAARLVEKYLKKDNSVLDVGCGSGILSVICAKLGASEILATDLDPEAIISTEVNAKLNDCSSIISVRKNDLLKGISSKADLIVANITAEFVSALAPDAAKNCHLGTVFIGSGIIDIKADYCLENVRKAGFSIIETIQDDCWVAFAATI